MLSVLMRPPSLPSLFVLAHRVPRPVTCDVMLVVMVIAAHSGPVEAARELVGRRAGGAAASLLRAPRLGSRYAARGELGDNSDEARKRRVRGSRGLACRRFSRLRKERTQADRKTT